MSMWEKLKIRKKLMKVFKAGGFYLGSSEHPIFPKIHSVTLDPLTITFTIPKGLDPKLLKKNFFVFEQYFGKHVELDGDIQTFVLTIHTSVLPSSLAYEYQSYAPSFKGLNIPIIAGIDLNQQTIIYDMVENPHLLIAGETGSGKSTQLRSVLCTLIQTLPPERLELYLCDLKRSEFHLFRHVEHVRGLFNSAKAMMPMLKYLQAEMQRRGDLLDHHEVVHVDDLPEPPPYIILCIDEVALLQDEKPLMKLVEEISSIGRALGVFLILSMQRPDSKVLDGKLKINLIIRMGFKCADLTNSRIVGTPGSEKLKHKGRFLLKIPKYSEPKEIQAPYLALDEAKTILEPYKSIKGKGGKFGRSVPSDDIVDMEETENNIFGVLD